MKEKQNLKQRLKKLAAVTGQSVITEALQKQAQKNVGSALYFFQVPKDYDSVYEYVARAAPTHLKKKPPQKLFPEIVCESDRKILHQLNEAMGEKNLLKAASAVAQAEMNATWRKRCRILGGILSLKELHNAVEILESNKPLILWMQKNLKRSDRVDIITEMDAILQNLPKKTVYAELAKTRDKEVKQEFDDILAREEPGGYLECYITATAKATRDWNTVIDKDNAR